MDFQYFDELWKTDPADLAKQKKHWDLRAEEFNSYRSHTVELRTKKIMDYLTQKEISLQDMNILDIGCGSGQISLEFAKKAKSVTGIDISTKMIEYALTNSQTEGITNARFYELPWENTDLKDLGWFKKFDLALAIMTPAIDSRQSLEKMMAASKGYCFLSGHLERYEKVKAEIEQKVLRRKQQSTDPERGAIYCSFNILWLHGIYPEISYHYLERENDRTVGERYDLLLCSIGVEKAFV
jgi:SAM-dependent methyltransferase